MRYISKHYKDKKNYNKGQEIITFYIYFISLSSDGSAFESVSTKFHLQPFNDSVMQWHTQAGTGHQEMLECSGWPDFVRAAFLSPTPG